MFLLQRDIPSMLRVCQVGARLHETLESAFAAWCCLRYQRAFVQEIDCAWELHNLRESLNNCGRAVTLISENVDAAAFASAVRWAARDSARGVPSVFHFSGHGNPGVLYLESHDARAAPLEVRSGDFECILLHAVGCCAFNWRGGPSL